MAKNSTRAATVGLLALLVGAFPTLVIGEIRVYGSIRQAVVQRDVGESDGAGLEDVESRFGLRGSEMLPGGLTVFGRWEWGGDASVQGAGVETRLGFIGINGEFGSLSVGSQWSAWDNFVGGDHMNLVDEGVWNSGTRRNGRSLKFARNFGGLAVEADTVLAPDEGGRNRGLLDEIQLAVGYRFSRLIVQAAVIDRDSGESGYLDGGTIAGVRVSFSSEALTVSAAFATDANFRGDVEEINGVKLRASLTRGPNQFMAIYTAGEQSESGNTPTGVSLGYQHNFSKRTKVALEIASVDPDIAGRDMTMEGGVLFRHDW